MPVVTTRPLPEEEDLARPQIVTPAFQAAPVGSETIQIQLNLQASIHETPNCPISIELNLDVLVKSRSTGTDRRTIVVQNDGTVIGPLQAVQGDITWRPSEPAQFTLDFAHNDLNQYFWGNTLDEFGIGEAFREVQLWRGDRLLTWGPIVPPKLENGKWTAPGQDCGWYLNRTIGPAANRNLIEDGLDSASGFSKWTHGLLVAGVTRWLLGNETGSARAQLSSHPIYRTPSILIYDITTDALEEGHPCAFRELRINAAAFPQTVTFTARVYCDQNNGPNFRKSGLLLAWYPADQAGGIYAGCSGVATSTIDRDFPERQAIYQSVSLTIPHTDSDTIIHYRCEGPLGFTYYDDLFLEIDTGLDFSGEDQTGDIAWKIVDHLTANPSSPYTFALKNPQYPWVSYGYDWSNVNIQSEANPTGIKRDRRYTFSQHTTGLAALSEFQTLHDGFEWDIGYTKNSRTFRTYFRKMGHLRLDCPLRSVDGHGNLTDWAFSFEGSRAATHVVVAAAGGSKRQGTDSDPSLFANSLTLIQLLQVPIETPISSLASIARRQLAIASNPAVLAVKLRAEPFFSAGLGVGDYVPVRIAQDWMDISSTWRIVEMTLTSDDYLQLVLNPVTD